MTCYFIDRNNRPLLATKWKPHDQFPFLRLEGRQSPWRVPRKQVARLPMTTSII